MEPTNQGEVPKSSQVIQIDEGQGPRAPGRSGPQAPPGLCFNKCAKNSGLPSLINRPSN